MATFESDLLDSIDLLHRYLAEFSYSGRNIKESQDLINLTKIAEGNPKSDQPNMVEKICLVICMSYPTRYMTRLSYDERNIEGVLEKTKSDQNIWG